MELSVCAVVRVRVRETKPNQTDPNRTEAKRSKGTVPKDLIQTSSLFDKDEIHTYIDST